MTTITSKEFREYDLGREVFDSFKIEKFRSNDSLLHIESVKSCTPSVQALNFAMTQDLTDLALLMIELFKKLGQSHLLDQNKTRYTQLTALHVASMLLRPDFVSPLLEARANPNVRDHREWTPLHHAALVGKTSVIDLLLNKGAAEPKALNDSNGTYREIYRLTQPPRYEPEKLTHLLWEDETGKEQPLTQGQFKALTGAQYLEENFVERTWMIQKWKEPKDREKDPEIVRNSPSIEIHRMAQQAYERQFSTPPAFKIRKVTHDDRQMPLAHSPGFGLFATKDHKVGEVLGEYKAHIGPEDDNGYTFNKHWQALKFRNEMALSNDGCPNLLCVMAADSMGCPERAVFIVSAPIRKGEEICWNYGAHPIKTTPYLELKPQMLRTSLKSHNFEELLKRGQRNLSRLSLEDHGRYVEIQYLIQTPKALFNLVFDGSFPTDRMKQFVQIAFPFASMAPVLKSQTKLIEVADKVVETKKRIEAKENKKDSAIFAKVIEDLQSTKGVAELVSGMEIALPQIEAMIQDGSLSLPKIPDDEKGKKPA